MEHSHKRRWIAFHRFVPCAAVALFVLVARLWLISEYGTSLPIHDQWGGEGFYLLKPWYEGRLTFAGLLGPHNEHRLFFSRVLTLALTSKNGQWDSMLMMVFDAGFCGVLAVLCLYVWFRLASGQFRLVAFVAITLSFALPYAYENILWGFQSCFYFLLFFSLLGLWGLVLHRPFSVGWIAGVVGVVCACLSMASGVLAAVAVGAVLALQLILRQRPLREVIPTALLLGIVITVNFHFQATVPAHAVLRAQTVSAWITFFGRCLAWPMSDEPYVALIAYAPFIFLATSQFTPRFAQKEDAFRPRLPLLCGVGIWVILQAAAMAYSRGGDGAGRIASRYLDVLGLGIVVNVLCLRLLMVKLPKGRFSLIVTVLGFAWLAAALVAGMLTSYAEIRGQYGRQGYLQSAGRAIRGYLVTKDHRYLEGEPHPVPYPNIEALTGFLNDKTIQAILPASARSPLHLEKSATSDNAFTQTGYSSAIDPASLEGSWGSYSPGGAVARGSMITELFYPRLPYLQLEIAGSLDKNTSLVLRGGNKITPISWLQHYPRGQNHPAWRTAYARIPASQVRIEARDDSTTSWFAFREPTEMGELSYYAQRIVQFGEPLCFLGVALGVLSLVVFGWPTVRRPQNRVALH